MYLCVYRVVSVMHAMICTVYLGNDPQTFWCDPVATFQQVPEPIYIRQIMMFSICEHGQCLSVNCYLRTNVMMALTIHVRVYCLDVVVSSLCISSALRSYLFPLQQALSLALSAFKELVCTCDHARMCTVEPVYLCITCK